MKIACLNSAQATQVLPDLASLLYDAVNGGASIGFLPSLSPQEAGLYWREVIEALNKPSRIMLIAQSESAGAGTVQLN